MVKYLNSNSINGRGRRPSILSKISAHFIKKNGKPENAEKFADDKARILALELINDTFLPFLDKKCTEEVKKIMSSREKTHKKSGMVIKALSINNKNWTLLNAEFKKHSKWKDRLQVILKIRYIDSYDKEDRIFNHLIDELFNYLCKKSSKKSPTVDSTNCSSKGSQVGEDNHSGCFETESYESIDQYLATDSSEEYQNNPDRERKQRDLEVLQPQENKLSQFPKKIDNPKFRDQVKNDDEHEMQELESLSCMGAEDYNHRFISKFNSQMILDSPQFIYEDDTIITEPHFGDFDILIEPKETDRVLDYHHVTNAPNINSVEEYQVHRGTLEFDELNLKHFISKEWFIPSKACDHGFPNCRP